MLANNAKKYIATLTFVSGEFEQTFHKIFTVGKTETPEKVIDKYLINYYSEGEKYELDLFFYYGGEIAIRIEDYKELTDLKQVEELLAI